jgi:hypothetical protein
VLLQNVLGELSSLSVSVVTSDGVKDVNFILDETLSSHLKRSLSFLDKTALLAVGGVGQLQIWNANDILFVRKLGRSRRSNVIANDGTTKSYLDARISNGGASNKVQGVHTGPFLFWNNKQVSNEDSLVPIPVHAKGEAGDFAVFQSFDPVVCELRNAGRQARGKTTRSHHGDVHVLSFKGKVCHFRVDGSEQDDVRRTTDLNLMMEKRMILRVGRFGPWILVSALSSPFFCREMYVAQVHPDEQYK